MIKPGDTIEYQGTEWIVIGWEIRGFGAQKERWVRIAKPLLKSKRGSSVDTDSARWVSMADLTGEDPQHIEDERFDVGTLDGQCRRLAVLLRRSADLELKNYAADLLEAAAAQLERNTGG